MQVEIIPQGAVPPPLRTPRVREVYERIEHYDLVIVLQDGGHWTVSRDDLFEVRYSGTDGLDIICQRLFDKGALRLLWHTRISSKSVQPKRMFA